MYLGHGLLTFLSRADLIAFFEMCPGITAILGKAKNILDGWT